MTDGSVQLRFRTCKRQHTMHSSVLHTYKVTLRLLYLNCAAEIMQVGWHTAALNTSFYSTMQIAAPRTLLMASAVLTGTVDFSTTILGVVATAAIMRAAPSQ